MKCLYDTHVGYLATVCARYVPARTGVVNDLLQESFIKILGSLDRFQYRGPGSLRAWMSRIVVNEALQWLRKNKQLPVSETDRPLPEPEEDEPPIWEEIPSAEILRMIGELPAGYRTVFNLFVFEEKSHKEIGEILHIAENSSASQYHRARKMLAQMITNYQKQHA